MSDRRTFFQGLASLPMLGMAPQALPAPSSETRHYFRELGVRTFINAAGTYTALTGSLMLPEVVEAIAATSKQFVSLTELQDKVGARIAGLLGAEAAMVTSGAAGALACGTAACITATNTDAIRRLPDLTGLKNEVIVQRAHRFAYDHSVRATGVRMVEIETAAELAKAVGKSTAMMLFFNDAEPRGQIKAADWVALGKKYNVPTFNDAAADVPPLDNLTRYIKMGFDLVTFSGGRALRGPQSAGLLLGRKNLIEAARLNTSPYSDTFARGMKVNKEEMVGMLIALESYLNRDHAAEEREWQRRVNVIVRAVADLPSLQAEVIVPQIANRTPHVHLQWDCARIPTTPPDVMKKLRDGEPSVELCPPDKLRTAGPDRVDVGTRRGGSSG
jgi:L-seryl-tRNA(Ser) seleniumtransferase